MADPAKLDKKDVAEAVRKIKESEKRYSDVVSDVEKLKKRISLEAEKLCEKEADKMISEMDVEVLSGEEKGIRVSYLKENGLASIGDVHKASVQKIAQINGISDTGAVKIKEIAENIVLKAKENAHVSLYDENGKPNSNEIIYDLYSFVNASYEIAFAEKMYAENKENNARLIKKSKTSTSFFGRIFSSKKKKEEGSEACRTLVDLSKSEYCLNGEKTYIQYRKIHAVSRTEKIKDFENNPAKYVAVFEGFLPFGTVKSSVYSGIPEELADKINAYNIDLSYMKATLRSYQLFGTKYIMYGENVLLGDEMGLGKTIEAIAAMACLYAEGKTHFMVVCPASVLVNWCREIVQHSMLTVVKIHGSDEEAVEKWVKEGGVAVTTYESISRFTLPDDFTFSMLTLDEAHYVKNPKAQRTLATQRLIEKTEKTLFMTGTPLENRVDEMCFLVSLLNKEIADKIEGMKFLSAAESFRQHLAPVYLRRVREDVLKELPELIEYRQWCEMTEDDKKTYRRAVMSENFMAMRRVSWHIDDISRSSKARALLDICDESRDDDRKIIVFSFFRDTLSKVENLLSDRKTFMITGDISPEERQNILDEFKKAPAGSVLIAQVQAGGTGLNIQTASVIIFCEPQLKPSIENQAISRAYRMGQLRSVLVYRLLCDETVDERIIELLEEKQNIFDNFADESVIGEKSMAIDNNAVKEIIASEKAKMQSA